MNQPMTPAQHARADAVRSRGTVPITVRTMSERRADREWNFVHETTLKMRWPRGSGITFRDWRQMFGPVAELWMGEGRCLVADAGDGVLLGFAVAVGENTVASLYVKAAFRGQGVGLALLRESNLALPYRAYQPTECWWRWCKHHKLPWLHSSAGHDRDAAIGAIHTP